MKNTTKIIFGFLIVIIIGFCLIYKNKTHEGFEDPLPPSSASNPFSNNEIQTIDRTINNLGVFANGLSTIEPSKITQQQLQDLQSKLLTEIKISNDKIRKVKATNLKSNNSYLNHNQYWAYI
jgi:hypothetical protein